MSCPTDNDDNRQQRRQILDNWRERLQQLADSPEFVSFGLDCWRAFDKRLPAYPVPLVPRDPSKLEWVLVAAAAWLDTCGNWQRCVLSEDLKSIVRRATFCDEVGQRHNNTPPPWHTRAARIHD